MSRIAIATCIDRPVLTLDDELLGQALTSAGVSWCAVPWNDGGVNWTKFDAVLIRSTWDYHRYFDAFLRWITHIEANGVPLWNEPSILRWSLNKRYLRDLETAGIPTIPTFWIERGAETIKLQQIMENNRWTDVVVKPAISAGGRGLMRFRSENVASANSELSLAAIGSDLLIQPFLPEIKHGELSFVLLGGTISHVVRKTPKRGDYRVQAKFGGSVQLVKPTAPMAHQATLAASIKGKQLYARVDGVEIDGRLIIMEIEFVEPDLFFHMDATAAVRFAAVLKRSLADIAGKRLERQL